MALPASWVDNLFGRLTVRYGAAFLRQWPDVDLAAVKADWADVLDGISGDSIGYALRYLPVLPPNAMQFRDVCRRAPVPEVPQLADDGVRADPEHVRAVVASIARPKPAASAAQQCIDNIERIVAERGGAISAAQRHMLEHCLRMPGTSTTLPVRRVAETEAEESA